MSDGTSATEVRCERCRFIIRPYEHSYDGWCVVCAGHSSFVISPEQSALNRKALAEHQAKRRDA